MGEALKELGNFSTEEVINEVEASRPAKDPRTNQQSAPGSASGRDSKTRRGKTREVGRVKRLQ